MSGIPSLKRARGVPGSVSADLLKPPRLALSLFVVTLCAAAIGSVAWAAVTRLDEVTIGEGRVIPAGKLKVVQSLEGGIIRDLLAREGQSVKEGEPLVRLDPTTADANLGEKREKITGLEALKARLLAEVNGKALHFPSALETAQPALVANERSIYESRIAELKSALSALEQAANQRKQEIEETRAKIVNLGEAVGITQREIGIMRPMVAKGVAAKIEVVRLEQRLNETKGALEAAELSLPRIEAALVEAQDKRREKELNFIGEARTKLSATEVELSSLTQSMRGETDKLTRTEIRSPVDGIIKTVFATTLGEVVKPGTSIIEIVPADHSLLIEAKVKPQDIAFLHPGLPVTVKVTAYDFSLYGGLSGTLEQIGADSITTEKGETYYLIRVRTAKNHLVKNGHELPILPGMVATAEVKTGSKTVLEYIAKPVTRLAHQSLRER
jgi:membrane fusion protein, adhesin transport system